MTNRLQDKVKAWHESYGKFGDWDVTDNSMVMSFPNIFNATEYCLTNNNYAPKCSYVCYIGRNRTCADPDVRGFTSSAELEYRCMHGVPMEDAEYHMLNSTEYRADLFQEEVVYGITGVECDVNEFVYGNPECMTVVDNVRQRKCLRFGMNTGISGCFSGDSIRECGLKIAQCLKRLDSLGFDLSLDGVTCCTALTKEVSDMAICIGIKSVDEPLDWSSLLFPVLSPAYHRGLIFNIRSLLPLGVSKYMGVTITFDEFIKDYHGDALEDYDYVFDLEDLLSCDVESIWSKMAEGMGLENLLGDWQD